ncbi:hypothetical protein [Pseudoalteromonas rubra]|uniref:hypothetical protein n=1 Tax=Pseudoalteromonas rubra TaxID=43658 RepID=UPI002DB6E90C|nr:hypothetical protein [Pseudoalteromonas rubra]MEC4091580.1 hypothetical protein [Pseudoalteromonas rubra]
MTKPNKPTLKEQLEQSQTENAQLEEQLKQANQQLQQLALLQQTNQKLQEELTTAKAKGFDVMAQAEQLQGALGQCQSYIVSLAHRVGVDVEPQKVPFQELETAVSPLFKAEPGTEAVPSSDAGGQ